MAEFHQLPLDGRVSSAFVVVVDKVSAPVAVDVLLPSPTTASSWRSLFPPVVPPSRFVDFTAGFPPSVFVLPLEPAFPPGSPPLPQLLDAEQVATGHSFFRCVVAEHIQHRSFLSGRSGWRYLHCFPFRHPSVVPQKRHCLALSIDAASFDTSPDLPALSWETFFWSAFVDGFSPPAGSGALWTRASISACRSSWNWSKDSVDFLSSMCVSMRNAETRKRAWGCCWRIFETTWSKAFTCSIKSGSPAPSSRARALCHFHSRSPFAALTGSFAWVNSDKRLDQHQVDKSSESCKSPLTARALGWPPSPDKVRLAAQATTSPWCVVPDVGLPKSHY